MEQGPNEKIDDQTIAAHREAAAVERRSFEIELRERLARVRPITALRKAELIERFAAIRAMTPDVPQTPAEVIVRQIRDA